MLRKTTPASACCRLCQQMVSDPHPSSHTRDCRSGNYNFHRNNLEDTGAGGHVHHGDGPLPCPLPGSGGVQQSAADMAEPGAGSGGSRGRRRWGMMAALAPGTADASSSYSAFGPPCNIQICHTGSLATQQYVTQVPLKHTHTHKYIYNEFHTGSPQHIHTNMGRRATPRTSLQVGHTGGPIVTQ